MKCKLNINMKSFSGGLEKVNEDLMYNISGTHEKQSKIYRFGQWILMIFINRYPNLHKMDNLVIDCKMRSVKYVSGKKLEPVLKTSPKKTQNFKLSNWEFEKFNTILKNRENSKTVQDEIPSRQFQEINERFNRIEEMLRLIMLQK